MRAYTVHAPSTNPEPERFVFVKDGFSWPALLIPLLWMLWHRLWLVLIVYIAFGFTVAGIDRYVDETLALLVGIAGALILGLEGNNLRRMALRARRWRDVGESFGRNLSEAEIRFFAGWADLSPLTREALLAGASGPAQPAAADADEPILGLFPEPDR